MTHTPHTSTRVLSKAVISTLIVGAVITLMTSVSLSACSPQDACTNLAELCPGMTQQTCVSTLTKQDQEVIDCIYYATTCEAAHECLSVEEDE